MEWIIGNWESLFAIITAIVTIASIVAKLTPSEADNRVVGYVLKFIDFIALNNKPTEIKK